MYKTYKKKPIFFSFPTQTLSLPLRSISFESLNCGARGTRLEGPPACPPLLRWLRQRLLLDRPQQRPCWSSQSFQAVDAPLNQGPPPLSREAGRLGLPPAHVQLARFLLCRPPPPSSTKGLWICD